tara:strand:+ start:764 stop:946 length:183 start_codon:yes stop_codon:yes gene_type:complete
MCLPVIEIFTCAFLLDNNQKMLTMNWATAMEQLQHFGDFLWRLFLDLCFVLVLFYISYGW